MDIQRLRDTQFPVCERYIYLNHASVAPVSVAVRTAMEEIVRDVAEHGIAHIDEWRAVVDGARRSAAALVGARADQIAFLKNTTEGLATVALGVDWQVGDSVVISADEFPSNAYPWLALRDRGVRVHRVPSREGRFVVEDFANTIDARTRVLSISSVQFFNGFRSDLIALGQLCEAHDILFVVDGIQSLGALRLDVTQARIDCLSADAHKWLMGPEGAALFYVSDRALARLRVVAPGWASVRSAHDFLDLDTTLQDDARRFESGSQNTAGIAGLRAAINLLLDIGMDTVQQRVLSLTDRLATGIEGRGYELLSSRRQGEASGIVTFRHTEITSQTIAHNLQSVGAQLTDRAGTVRLSPHVYNTETEIDTVLAALP